METSAALGILCCAMVDVADRHALIPTKEAARMLDCHVETLRRAVADGRIEAVRLRERGWMRFRRSDRPAPHHPDRRRARKRTQGC